MIQLPGISWDNFVWMAIWIFGDEGFGAALPIITPVAGMMLAAVMIRQVLAWLESEMFTFWRKL